VELDLLICIPLGATAWMIMVAVIPSYYNIDVYSGSGNLFSRLESIKKVFYMEQRVYYRPLDR